MQLVLRTNRLLLCQGCYGNRLIVMHLGVRVDIIIVYSIVQHFSFMIAILFAFFSNTKKKEKKIENRKGRKKKIFTKTL